jgi:hypothetical protein
MWRLFLLQQNSDKLLRRSLPHDRGSWGIVGPSFRARRPADRFLKEVTMKKALTVLLATAAVAGTTITTPTQVYAQRWLGPAIVGGIIGGAVIGGILATRPRGYVVYPGYAQPVYGPGCYWAAQPVYDPYGRVVGYSGQPVQVCPR